MILGYQDHTNLDSLFRVSTWPCSKLGEGPTSLGEVVFVRRNLLFNSVTTEVEDCSITMHELVEHVVDFDSFREGIAQLVCILICLGEGKDVGYTEFSELILTSGVGSTKGPDSVIGRCGSCAISLKSPKLSDGADSSEGLVLMVRTEGGWDFRK
jgi:hypothetical protein